jgi:hypothetical protein
VNGASFLLLAFSHPFFKTKPNEFEGLLFKQQTDPVVGGNVSSISPEFSGDGNPCCIKPQD